jgi:hypothetical protein
MKSFVDFRLILEAKAKKGRGGADYNYEHSFANIYNHMVSIDKKNIIKGAVQRKDIFTVVDYLAREIHKAQTDQKHPLHFNNAPIDGFTKGEKTEEHEKKYYEKLLDQQYSFLNFVQSASGRKNFVKHHTAKVEGATKIPTTSKYAETSGKKQDTSKVDIRFFDKEGNPAYGLSLKDAKGAVVNSSGADETKALIVTGVGQLLNQQLKDGTITPEQKNELELFVNDNANELALFMAGTKGMSKEQQQDALPQMQSYIDKLELKIPGATEAFSSEAITGKGKFGDADSVDALFSSGRGGEVIEDPAWLAQYIRQRARLGKGGQKSAEGGQRPTTFSGDSMKDKVKSAEDRPTDSEWLRNWAETNKPGWTKQIDKMEPETQAEVRSSLETGEMGIDEFDALINVDKKLKNFRQLRSDLQMRQAQTDHEDALEAQKDAQKKLATNSDGSKRHLQYQAQARANNPDLDAEITYADNRVATTQKSIADIQAKAAQAKEKEKPETQQPETQQPEPTKPEPQQPQQSEPTKPEPQQPEAPKPEPQVKQEPVPVPKPEEKKKKKPVETPNGELSQE